MAEQNPPSKRAPESSKFWDTVMRKDSPEPAPTPPRRRDPRMELSYILNPVDDIYEANKSEAARAAREYEPNHAVPRAFPSSTPMHPAPSYFQYIYDRFPPLDLNYHDALHEVMRGWGPLPRRLPPVRPYPDKQAGGGANDGHRDLRTGPEHVEANRTNGIHHPKRNRINKAYRPNRGYRANRTYHTNGGPSSEGESASATNDERINEEHPTNGESSKVQDVNGEDTDEEGEHENHADGDAMDMDRESHQSHDQQSGTLPSIPKVFAGDDFLSTPLSSRPIDSERLR